MKIQPKLILSPGSRAVEREVEETLRAIRDAQHNEVSEYFAKGRHDTCLQGVDPNMVEVLQVFSQAFAQHGDRAQAQMQRLYVLDNPHLDHERFHLNEVCDRSTYDRLHARYHLES